MKKLIIGAVAVALFAVFAVACEDGGQQTVRGTVGSVEHVTLEATIFGFKTRDVGPATLVVILDENNDKYFLATWGSDPALKRGQEIEAIFEKGDTVVTVDLTLYIQNESGKITGSELIENAKFKKTISYTILDSKEQ